MIYGRGTVWVICSEQYDPKFFIFDCVRYVWNTDIAKSYFMPSKELAESYLKRIRDWPSVYGLKVEELEYTSIIELELVQYCPNEGV